MIRGKRYKSETRKLNKKKVAMVLIIILAIIYLIIHPKKKNIEVSKTNIIKSEIKEEKITIDEENIQETSTLKIKKKEEIEGVEDREIKQIIDNVRIEKKLNESNFGFFYYNINTKKYYFYNKDTYFKGASTVKVPVAMLYYDKINNNEMSINDTIVYTSECYELGDGATAATYSYGDKIQLNFLLKQSIVNSDNTAVNILIENLGYDNCRGQIASYSDNELPAEFISTNITSADYAYDVINHLYDNIQDYGELIEYMKISSNREYLKKYIKDYDVAHKYGSYEGYVHDYGIVFGETTYLIGIFTKSIPSADELIAQLSLDILNYANAK